MGLSASKVELSIPPTRKELAAVLRKDEAFLELVEWAAERGHHVTVDDQCWLQHSCVPKLACTVILEDISSYAAVRTEFMEKAAEVRERIAQCA